MKKHHVRLASGAAVASFVSVLAMQGVAFAVVNFVKQARQYSVTMVRAMDPCTSPTLSVVDTALPTGACPQTNTVTDSTITMSYARIAITKTANGQGKVTLVGAGFPFGARVRIRLSVRTTNKHHSSLSGATQIGTFEDVTLVDCGSTPYGYIAGPSGIIASSTSLSSCIGAAGCLGAADPTHCRLSVGNVEILDAVLVNVDTNQVFAVPGILE